MSRDMLEGIADRVFAGADALDAVGGRPAGVWTTVLELGWPWVGIDQAVGGAGGEPGDLLTLLRAVGEHGAAIPLLESAIGLSVLASAGQDIARPGIVTIGGVRPRDAVVYDPANGTVRGRLPAIPWADAADQLVIYAHVGNHTRAVLLDRGAEGVTVTPDVNLAGEPRDTVDLDNVAVIELEGATPPDVVLDRIALGVVAQSIGALETASRLTREHVTTREQFGRALVRLPVVSSMLAELASERELAKAVLAAAADAPTPELVAAARITVARSSTIVARHAHQLHGAIGTTREHDLHRTTRRLWAWRDEWAPPSWWAQRLGTAILERGVDDLWNLLTTTPGRSP